MAAAFAEICVGLAGQAGLALGIRLDLDLGFLEKLIQTSASDRVTLGVRDDSGFEIACRGKSSRVGGGDGLGVDRRVVSRPVSKTPGSAHGGSVWSPNN